MTIEEPLSDKSQTLLTIQVPDNLDPAAMKRELALKGYQVVKAYFEHNTITNERTGRGFIQLRAANPRYMEELKKEVDAFGLNLSKKKNAQPNRNLSWRI